MASPKNYLAFDLGASSGRAVLGRFTGTSIELEITHRFENRSIPVGNALYWDILGLYGQVLEGLRKTATSTDLTTVGIDTWGIDFGLLDTNDELLGTPRCYRDPRVDGMMAEVLDIVTRDHVFEQTGIQFLELNTLYQLYAMRKEGSPLLEAARTFLTVPDLLNFFLTGEKASEMSIASTTQFYNPRDRRWATELLEALSIPTDPLPEIVPPGTFLGSLRSEVQEACGTDSVGVISPACHDTGSAVAATPLASPDAAYISCGTWALMGAEIPNPVITPDALSYNLTNEVGADETIRFLKNITGLWLVQECKRTWDLARKEYDYGRLTDLARSSDPRVSFIDPDHPDFVPPGDMPLRVQNFCRQTGQTVPNTEGAVIRCCLESLALKCRHVLGQLEAALHRPLTKIHVVGGGVQNALLCQLISSATEREVVAGPVEATALGNLLIQAMGDGELADLAQAREVVRNSTDVVTYTPDDGDAWDEAYSRFSGLIE